jgi:hypothetical protein
MPFSYDGRHHTSNTIDMHAQRNYLNLLLNVRNVGACLAARGREFHSLAIRKLNVLLIFTLEAL